jgi:two-component system, OmpR family, osmolarity sensor histidine kinase EnvZ
VTALPGPIDTAPAELDSAGDAGTPLPRRGISLFWRTFILLGALLIVSIVAWLQALRTFEQEPRARQTAQQIASLVNLSRAARVPPS